MGVIKITSWLEGLCKVSLTKLQMDILKLSLIDSKKNVDDLLEGKSIIIEITKGENAKKFVEEAKKIGAICSYIEDSILDRL